MKAIVLKRSLFIYLFILVESTSVLKCSDKFLNFFVMDVVKSSYFHVDYRFSLRGQVKIAAVLRGGGDGKTELLFKMYLLKAKPVSLFVISYRVLRMPTKMKNFQ